LRPTILLDENITGLDVYLRDSGWKTVTVKDEIGAGADDGAVIELARKNGYVLVTPDNQLAKRCERLHIPVIELGMGLYADAIDKQLSAEYPQ
jgi:rRNA-processing protein FCF1